MQSILGIHAEYIVALYKLLIKNQVIYNQIRYTSILCLSFYKKLVARRLHYGKKT